MRCGECKKKLDRERVIYEVVGDNRYYCQQCAKKIARMYGMYTKEIQNPFLKK